LILSYEIGLVKTCVNNQLDISSPYMENISASYLLRDEFQKQRLLALRDIALLLFYMKKMDSHLKHNCMTSLLIVCQRLSVEDIHKRLWNYRFDA
jgi:hypothetical protein